MQHKTRTRHLIWGIVIWGLLLAGAGIAIARFVISSAIPTMETVTYFEESVQGLEEGAPVKFRGVTIGRVASIRTSLFARRHAVEVRTEIPLDEERFQLLSRDDIETRVRKMRNRGFRFRLVSSGLTGFKHLEGTYVPPSERAQKIPPFLPPRNYIPAAPSTLKSASDKLIESLTQLEKVNVARGFRQFQRLLSAVERADLARWADRFEATVDRIRGWDLPALGRTIREEFGRGSARIATLRSRDRIGQTEELLRAIEAVLPDAAGLPDFRRLLARARSQLDEWQGQLPEWARRFAPERLSAWLDDLDGAIGELAPARTLASVRKGVETADRAIRSTRRLVREIATFVRKLDALLKEGERELDSLGQ